MKKTQSCTGNDLGRLGRENTDLKRQLAESQREVVFHNDANKSLRTENSNLRRDIASLENKNNTLVKSEENLRQALDATAEALSIASRAIGNLNGIDRKPEPSFHPFMSPLFRSRY